MFGFKKVLYMVKKNIFFIFDLQLKNIDNQMPL